MTLEIKHSHAGFPVTVPDDGVSPVGSEEWNAAHGTSMDTARMLGRVTAAAGPIEELDAAAVRLFIGYFPAGTQLIFRNAAVPPGWTKDVNLDNYALRVVNGTGANQGGSRDFTAVFGITATDNFTLLTTHMPSHSHLTSTRTDMMNTGGGVCRALGFSTSTDATNSQGGGTAHQHGIDLRVKYTDVLLGTKD